MDNRNIIILVIFILMIYILYCQNICNTKENFNSKNIDYFTDNVTINEAIKNVSLLSRELLKGDNLTLPSNLILDGDTNGVPLHSIILWTDHQHPPYPNTNPITRNGHQLSYTLSATDCWYPCIGGTINVDGVNIDIPDMKGRMIVGYGATDGTDFYQRHYFDNPGTHVGGELPLRDHSHSNAKTNYHGNAISRRAFENIGNRFRNAFLNPGNARQEQHPAEHTHKIPVGDNYDRMPMGSENIDRCPNSNDCRVLSKRPLLRLRGFVPTPRDLQYLSGENPNRYVSAQIDGGDHSHRVNVQERSHNYGTNNYSRSTIPHSIVLQYWMRVR